MKRSKQQYNHSAVDKYLKRKKNPRGMSDFVNSSKKSIPHVELSALLARLRELDKDADYNFFGNQWPREIRELGECINRFYLPDSLDNEIQWVIYQVKRHKEKISEFVLYRRKVEKSILLGLYDEALSYLQIVYDKFGYSIWYFEMKILVLIYQGRQTDALDLLSKVNEANKDTGTGFVSYLLHYIYKRCAVGVSAYEYDMVLENKKRNVTAFQNMQQDYLLFKLNMFRSLDSAAQMSNLMMEGTNALVDRYMFLQNIIKALFVKDEDNKPKYLAYAKTLYNFTKDKSFWSYLAYIDVRDIPEDYYDTLFLQILDAYYTGKYEEVCALCKSHVADKDVNFDVIRFYCRALIFLKNGFSPISPKTDCILNKIAYEMYMLMSGSNDDNYAYKLYQISKNIQSFNIAAPLDNYIKEERTEATEPALGILSSAVFDPYLTKLFLDKEDKLNYLNKGLEKVPTSIVLAYNIRKTKEEVTEEERIVDYIRKVDNAHILFNKGEYDNCIEIMNEVLESNDDCTPIIQTAVKCIYESHCANDNEKKAISFYVKWLVMNESYVTKISTTELINQMRKRRYRNVLLNENTLIFLLRNAENPSDKAYMLKQYGLFNGFDSFEGLIKYLESKNSRTQEAFLHFLLLDDDIFNSSTYVRSSKEILEAQDIIIKRLIELDTPNRSDYQDFADRLHLQMMVYSGIEKLDDSKIYADKDSIIRYETDEARRLFDQFRIQKELENKSDTIFLLYDTSKDEKSDDTLILGIPTYLTDDSLKEICLQLFDSICRPYLKSKFGIGAYLSARIRHGVFETQIYAGFLEKQLFLSTSNGVYTPSQLWRAKYGLNSIDNDKVYNAQVAFSRSINELIDRYKENVLQIKYGGSEKGMFDFNFTDEEICRFVRIAYKKDCDFETFCVNLLNRLSANTKDCLERIRHDIRDSLKSQILEQTQRLISETQDVNNINFVNDFRETVESAQRDIETRLMKMEGWFNISESKLEDFNLYNHIHVVWGISGKMFPCVKFDYKIISDQKELKNLWIKGDFNFHFSDLLCIFFTNMIKYSKATAGKREFVIEHKIENNILTLVFTNDFDGDEIATTEKMKKLINTEGLYSKEGGSGLSKARKIVRFDLKNANNAIDAFIEKGKCISTLKIDLAPIRI